MEGTKEEAERVNGLIKRMCLEMRMEIYLIKCNYIYLKAIPIIGVANQNAEHWLVSHVNGLHMLECTERQRNE